MYVVLSGRVAISIKSKVVEWVGPGGVFGEMALVDQSPRAATATAETDCDLLSINRSDFLTDGKDQSRFRGVPAQGRRGPAARHDLAPRVAGARSEIASADSDAMSRLRT